MTMSRLQRGPVYVGQVALRSRSRAMDCPAKSSAAAARAPSHPALQYMPSDRYAGASCRQMRLRRPAILKRLTASSRVERQRPSCTSCLRRFTIRLDSSSSGATRTAKWKIITTSATDARLMLVNSMTQHPPLQVPTCSTLLIYQRHP